jgi:hypothetical protein
LKDGTIPSVPQAVNLSEEKSRTRKIEDFFDNKKKKKKTINQPLTEEIEVSSSEEEVKTSSGASSSQPIAFKFKTNASDTSQSAVNL